MPIERKPTSGPKNEEKNETVSWLSLVAQSVLIWTAVLKATLPKPIQIPESDC